MSVVTVALGQAGNQVGASFFETLAAHESGRNSRCFFRTSTARDGIVVPRAVLVDTEPKVVQAIVARPTRVARAAAPSGRRSRLEPSSAATAAITLRYDLMQTYCRQSGSANNWAFGFRVHGPLCWAHPARAQGISGGRGTASRALAAQLRRAAADGPALSSSAVWNEDSARVSELVRREVERCDEFEGFLVLQSAAGGTGSGVGTFATRALRDEYRTAFICNALIWPFAAGEVIVQNYNCALALAHVANASDAVIVLENDAIGSVARRLLRLESPTFSALNGVIARQLASVFLPTRARGSGGRVQRRGILADPIRHLCAHPGYKLLGLKLTPTMPASSHAFSQTSWPSLAKQLRQMQLVDSHLDDEQLSWRVDLESSADSRISRCVATWATLRGDGAEESATAQLVDELWAHPRIYAPWATRTRAALRSTREHFGGYERVASALSNSQGAIAPVARCVAKAREMFSSGAYVHQYEMHGVEPAAFTDAFRQLDQIVLNYKSI